MLAEGGDIILQRLVAGHPLPWANLLDTSSQAPWQITASGLLAELFFTSFWTPSIKRIVSEFYTSPGSTECLLNHAQILHGSSHPTVLAGDFNVVPTDLDIYNPRSWLRDAQLQRESRASFKQLLAQGWVDAVRHLYLEQRIYTFWDYFRNHWAHNAGSVSITCCSTPVSTLM